MVQELFNAYARKRDPGTAALEGNAVLDSRLRGNDRSHLDKHLIRSCRNCAARGSSARSSGRAAKGRELRCHSRVSGNPAAAALKGNTVLDSRLRGNDRFSLARI